MNTTLQSTTLLLVSLGLVSLASADTHLWSGKGGKRVDNQLNWGSPTWADGDTAIFDDNYGGKKILVGVQDTRAMKDGIATAGTVSLTIINSGGAKLVAKNDTILRIADNYTLNMKNGKLSLGALSLVGNDTSGTGVTGSTYIQSGSAVLNGTRDFLITKGSAQFLGGRVTFSGSDPKGSGSFDLGNGNDVQIGGGAILTFAGNLSLHAASALNILASSTGSLTLGGITSWNGAIDFASGTNSSFSLTITGYDAAKFEAEYADGDLLFGGSNATTFADVFRVTGDTLTVFSDSPSDLSSDSSSKSPSPSSAKSPSESPSAALIGLGSFSFILREEN